MHHRYIMSAPFCVLLTNDYPRSSKGKREAAMLLIYCFCVENVSLKDPSA